MNVTKQSHEADNLVCQSCNVDYKTLVLFPEESILLFRAKKLLHPTIMNFATKRAVIKFSGFTLLYWFHTLSLTQISYYWKRWNLPSLLEWNTVVMWKVNSNIPDVRIMILFCHKASPETKRDWWKCNASWGKRKMQPARLIWSDKVFKIPAEESQDFNKYLRTRPGWLPFSPPFDIKFSFICKVRRMWWKMAFVKYILGSGKFGKTAFFYAVQDRKFISRVGTSKKRGKAMASYP